MITRLVFNLIWFIHAALAWLAILAAGNTAMAAIPVTACGAALIIPGGQYELVGNLTCATAPAVQVAADGVSFDLKGFTIFGPGIGSGIITAFGPSCKGVTNILIRNGTVAGFSGGIDLCAPFVASGTAMNARIAAMRVTRNVDGIRIFNSNGNTVQESNIFENRGVGVRLSNSHGNRFVVNTINSNVSSAFSGGILLSQSNGNMLESNRLFKNGRFGIFIQNSDKNEIAGNTVNDTNVGGLATTGIVVIGPSSAGNTLRANTAENNQNGISLGCSGGCALVSPEVGGVVESLIIGNHANGNKVFGIDLSDNTASNTVSFNKATGNGAFDGHDDQGGPPCGSNQWQNNSFGTVNQPCVQ